MRLAAPGDASPFRIAVIVALALAVIAPVGLIIYQSMLSAAFFAADAKVSRGPSITSSPTRTSGTRSARR